MYSIRKGQNLHVIVHGKIIRSAFRVKIYRIDIHARIDNFYSIINHFLRITFIGSGSFYLQRKFNFRTTIENSSNKEYERSNDVFKLDA